MAEYGPDIALESTTYSMLLFTQFAYDVVIRAAENVGVENLTPEAIIEAAEGFEGNLFLGATAACPGPEPWVSQCSPFAAMAQFTGGELVMTQEFRPIDPTSFNWLLEG